MKAIQVWKFGPEAFVFKNLQTAEIQLARSMQYMELIPNQSKYGIRLGKGYSIETKYCEAATGRKRSVPFMLHGTLSRV